MSDTPDTMSAEAQVRHWKGRANDLEDMLREAETTLQDWMDSSKALEAEMERELAASTRAQSDLQTRNEVLASEVETWRNKFQTAISESNRELAELRKELKMTTDTHNAYKAKLRDMELDNDELENAERMISESLADMEIRYNRAVEKTALLEEEVVAKEQLQEENQRLKDEIRDLVEELAVVRESRSASVASKAPSRVASALDELTLEDLDTKRPDSHSQDQQRSESRSGRESRHSELRASAISRRRSRLDPSIRAPRQSQRLLGAGANSIQQSTRAEARPSVANAAGARSRLADTSFTLRASKTLVLPALSQMSSRGGSSQMLNEMQSRLTALQSRLSSIRDPNHPDRSAIPRPSSRLGSSVGPAGPDSPAAFRPRASIDANSSFSGIPIPATSLSRSAARRPRATTSTNGDALENFQESSVGPSRSGSRNSTTLSSRVQPPSMSMEDWKTSRIRIEGRGKS
ncbi:hypothetical protein K437DRAFT_255494 [Tilletiaria anomala UBC 951]|uniref:NUDE domain-containing protein n=1 Tax=Tilletiaria anomala (strain ATCC 24038 / CBS 436.72 / UBC 951) TaxID=1037660 RepID=A0A066WCL5_TILAU|nr:uncharacterized protein K437DRAFT_255494 [Tilletiaria anomala UBC 951]KDN48520.1 hypothetical protein K437DRAFT_255494 [Tilletiaria anomala UBC 951]